MNSLVAEDDGSTFCAHKKQNKESKKKNMRHRHTHVCWSIIFFFCFDKTFSYLALFWKDLTVVPRVAFEAAAAHTRDEDDDDVGE